MNPEACPPHEMSYLTMAKLQYGATRAQESVRPASTHSVSDRRCVHIFLHPRRLTFGTYVPICGMRADIACAIASLALVRPPSGHASDRVDSLAAHNRMSSQCRPERRHISFRSIAGIGMSGTQTSHLLPTYARVDLAFERGEG